MDGENGGETRPDEKQGDVEVVGHGDWVIMEGSDILVYTSSVPMKEARMSILP
jgi:hypothetical protein